MPHAKRVKATRRGRKRLSAEERREAILASALEVFAGRGYHAASIDDIARQAGISKALIYEHFGSKEDLYLRLLEQGAADLFSRLAAAVGEVDGAAPRLEAGLDGFFRFVEERRGVWSMLFREASDAEVLAVLDRIVAQVTDIVATLIAADPGSGPRRGETKQAREEAIGMVAQMLVGAAQSLANWWADHQEVPRERLVDVAMGFAWLGLDRLRAGERWPGAAA